MLTLIAILQTVSCSQIFIFARSPTAAYLITGHILRPKPTSSQKLTSQGRCLCTYIFQKSPLGIISNQVCSEAGGLNPATKKNPNPKPIQLMIGCCTLARASCRHFPRETSRPGTSDISHTFERAIVQK